MLLAGFEVLRARKADSSLLLTSTLLGSHMFSKLVRRVWGQGAGGLPLASGSDGTRPTGELSEEHDVESGSEGLI